MSVRNELFVLAIEVGLDVLLAEKGDPDNLELLLELFCILAGILPSVYRIRV